MTKATQTPQPLPPLARLFPDLSPDEALPPEFDFEGLAKTLAELALNPENRTPFTVVVKGGWGRGKTTLLRRAKWLLEHPGEVTGEPGLRLNQVSRLLFQPSLAIRDTGGLAEAAPSHWADGKIPEGQENHPVVQVSWSAGEAFCTWLTRRLNGAGARGVANLPTEAQWEWCRDWKAAYPEAEQRDPTGPERGTSRVLRGLGRPRSFIQRIGRYKTRL